MTAVDIGAPAPLAELVAHYLAGVPVGELRLQRCENCSTVRFPPRPVCSVCRSAAAEWILASGRGTLWSFGIFHRKYLADHPVPVPYNVAVVLLEEGPKFLSNVVDVPDEELRIGLAVEAVVRDDGNGPLLKFRPAP